MSDTLTPEMEALKTRLRSTWMAGDFDLIARSYSPGARQFIDSLQLEPGTRLLDLACGSGNLALPAARAGALVTGADIAVNLLETARARAAEEHLQVAFVEGDAEQLPFPDASFDLVVSMFGAMFAPRPDLVAREILRVGGRFAMANWTPTGFVGQMFKLTGQHVPPPALMPSPLQWGVEATVRERFGAGAELKCEPRMIEFTFAMPPADVVEHFRKYYGPTQRAFEALEPERQNALRADLEGLWKDANQASDGTTRVQSEYLAVLGVTAPGSR